jgi:hypothetical protein
VDDDDDDDNGSRVMGEVEHFKGLIAQVLTKPDEQ